MSQPMPQGELMITKFSENELEQMHRFCLAYRDQVRAGLPTTEKQDKRFRIFSRVTYAAGVACD